jgi:hypothetical protein
VKNGEQRAAMAAFSFDDTLQWTFVRDGMVYEYPQRNHHRRARPVRRGGVHTDGTQVGGFSFSIAQPLVDTGGEDSVSRCPVRCSSAVLWRTPRLRLFSIRRPGVTATVSPTARSFLQASPGVR